MGEMGDASSIGSLGTVHMPISCAASVQAPFERGVALLHSFWYEEAQKQFAAVAAADPTCAIAQWGLAMTEWRPFWDGMPETRRLAGVAEIDKATALHAPTDREQRYISALSGYLHGADPEHQPAALAQYDAAMLALHTAYPDDAEATAFYGLALAASIGPNDPVGDARKALAVLLPAFEAHPDHPGYAHYIIHTCDSPQLARLALPAAEHYAAIAPASAHALHMPGHIFARLGMWSQDITSNIASAKASEFAYTHDLGGIGHEMHADEFLLYAYLQVANDAKAMQTMNGLPPLLQHLAKSPMIASDDMWMFRTYFQVEYPSIYHLEMHQWQDALAIPEPAGNKFASTRYYRYWAQTIAAGHLRNAAAADKAAAAAGQIETATGKEGSPIGIEIAAASGTVAAWQSFAHHNDAQALRQIAAAADMQDRTGQAEVDIPVREMYGDMLMEDNRPAEALVQYRTSLTNSPNRFNGLFHAGLAAEQTGGVAEAVQDYRQLLAVTDNGANTTRPEVAHARKYLKAHGGKPQA